MCCAFCCSQNWGRDEYTVHTVARYSLYDIYVVVVMHQIRISIYIHATNERQVSYRYRSIGPTSPQQRNMRVRVCVRPLFEYRMAGQGIGPRAHKLFSFSAPTTTSQSCVLVISGRDVFGAPIPNHIYISSIILTYQL